MAEDKKKEEIAVIDITEEYLKERIYEIRGQRVILDADLSEIYVYTTKAFNQQVKNNMEKFDEDFMFELTDDEVENLRSNFLTANLNSICFPLEKLSILKRFEMPISVQGTMFLMMCGQQKGGWKPQKEM